MQSGERIIRLVAAGVALIAAGWAISSPFREHPPLGVILVRVGFYGSISFGFLRRARGAKWAPWQWLLGSLLFGFWIWDGRGALLSVPALAAATVFTAIGAIFEWRQAAALPAQPERS